MKNNYCSFFLKMFIIDAVLIIWRNLINLFDVTFSGNYVLKLAEFIFHDLVFLLAIVQVVIAFKNRLKWSARIIGLYPLFFAMIALIIGIIVMTAKRSPISENNLFQVSTALSIYLLIVGMLQFLIGIWAKRDLAGGHYKSNQKSL